jgi:signal peptidase II
VRLRTASLIAFAVFAVDFALKYLVTTILDLDAILASARAITPFFALRFVANCGVSLGLLGDHSDSFWVRIGVVVVTSAIAIGVLVWMRREPHPVDRTGLALVAGGAFGNIADRVIPDGVLGKITAGAVRYPGCVIDYADLHFGEWRPFLIFNLADAAIAIGVVLLIGRSLLGKREVAPVNSSVNGPENGPVENKHA